MTITLRPEQQKWLEAEVAAGNFASVEEALDAAIVALMHPDAWVRRHLDEARAQIERGEFISHAEFKSELAERIKALGG
jgi:Arc/MetJ-type ribon-helix-helix transcriptional regulator